MSLVNAIAQLVEAGQEDLADDLIAVARPMSKIKKKPEPHMWFISKDSAGGYIVTMGDPKKSSSKIKFRASGDGAKDELKYWVKYNMNKLVSEDHVFDATGLKLVPEYYSQFYVDLKN